MAEPSDYTTYLEDVFVAATDGDGVIRRLRRERDRLIDLADAGPLEPHETGRLADLTTELVVRTAECCAAIAAVIVGGLLDQRTLH